MAFHAACILRFPKPRFIPLNRLSSSFSLSLCSQMANNEKASWVAGSFDAPPGFPPRPLQNSIGFSMEIAHLRAHDQGPPRRRTSRKRSRPQFYAPSTPPKLPGAPRRRGRPPKSSFMSRLVTGDSNPIPQEQMSSFISSLQISKDRSSLQVNDQVAEHDSIKKRSGDISIDKIQPRTNQRSSFPAPDIEELLVDISLTEVPYERAQGVGRNSQISEGINPTILQHVANALQYMTASQTAEDDAKVISTSSDFNRNLVHTLKAINKKHGDITQGCLLESDCMKTVVLLGICKVVEDLQKKQLKDLDGNSLDSYYTAVRDAENLKVDVQWLRSRLDEIRDACKLSDGAKGMVDERDRRVGKIDETKKELSQRRSDLERLKSEVRGIEEQLAREIVMVEELNKKFGDQMSKISQFQHANLMEGLI